MKKIDFNKIIGYLNYHRDWKIVFFSFLILMIVFSAIDGYIFWKNQKEMASDIDADMVRAEKLITLNQKSLKAVLEEIRRKEGEFEKNLTAPNIKDPSL